MNNLKHFLATMTDGMFFFGNAKNGTANTSLLFLDPIQTITILDPSRIQEAFDSLEKALKQGYSVAGMLHYELGSALDETKITAHAPMFGQWHVYQNYYEYEGLSVDDLRAMTHNRPQSWNDYWLKNIHTSVTMKEYSQAFARVMDYIHAGDTYQVNLTHQLNFDFFGNTLSFFLDLCEQQPTALTAFVRQGGHTILSLSPELFFRRTGQHICVQPMKGTLACHHDRRELADSIKTQAENIMIVDMERNDLGRLCHIGSIRVPHHFDIESYKTVQQMTSTIEGTLRQDVSWFDVFRALFPCGSVTGAPKIRTMQIIHELEKDPRGLYTGALGFIRPNNTAVFNIPIRTLELNTKNHTGHMGIGSGIVADSQCRAEYLECQLKAAFVRHLETSHNLITTILWEPQKGYTLLPYHLDRLESSTHYFRIPFDCGKTERKLMAAAKAFGSHAVKVRLMIHPSGENRIIAEAIQPMGSNTPKVCLSEISLDSHNIFLYHKTTHRGLYNRYWQHARDQGYADILFTNERGELTEGAISNVFIKNRGIYNTPPCASGLLAGVYRRHLLESDPQHYQEKVLYPRDLISAEGIYLCNAIHGLYPVAYDPTLTLIGALS